MFSWRRVPEAARIAPQAKLGQVLQLQPYNLHQEDADYSCPQQLLNLKEGAKQRRELQRI